MKTFAKYFITGLILLLLIVIVFLVLQKNLGNQNFSFGSPQKPVDTPKTTTIFFAGDIMLSRNVAAKIYAANNVDLPFANVADDIRKADIAFANLESPFNDTGNHSVEGSLVFNADPKFVDGLKNAGFDILSTANNHTLDQGQRGLNLTYDFLGQNGILPIGTTLACHDGEIIVKNGIKFGFLAYSYTAYNDGGKVPDQNVCDANDLPQVTQDVQALKAKSDVVIVSMHAGTEYVLTPNKLQTDFAQAASMGGADLVIGAHPHWIQKPIENLNDKTWVFYSLGNFVFDQMWSTETRQGLTLEVTYENKTLKNIKLKPVIIDNYCCPRFANESETTDILKRLDLTSPTL